MTIWHLIGKEILHRRLNFVLAVASVAVAVAVVVAAVMVLRAHDLATERMLSRMQAKADKRLAVMEDDYRKYMKELGFNLLILPAEQNLTEFWTRGYASHTMPEQYVHTLANSRTTIMRHLLPLVQKQVFWPERKRSIILIGTRGEVPLAHRLPKEPMLLAAPPGQVVVGYRLASDLNLQVGQAITLMGQSFTISKILPERGTADDATIWMDLATAQKLLGMQGQINAIEALQCLCADPSVEPLRREVASILPDTTVVVRQNKVTLRAKARQRARIEHEQAMAAAKAHRQTLRQARENAAAMLVPVMIIAAMGAVGLLAFGNVRQRIDEIGILRALGVGSSKLFTLFLSRSALVGVTGAVLGGGLGVGAGVALALRLEPTLGSAEALHMVPVGLMVGLVIAAPLLSAAAGWAPSLIAARQNPAEILAAP